MPRVRLIQSCRHVLRATRPANFARPACKPLAYISQSSIRPATTNGRALSTSAVRTKGIMPETDSPEKSTPTPSSAAPAEPTEITESEYHELADLYLDSALAKFEELQDKDDRLDVEYSSGVMTISVPGKGVYVLNKQPPNKQIWLSSPLSGPKRYDWCVSGDGQHDKEGTASGNWVYTRDNSTLSGLILEELEIDLDAPSGS